jgi:hypothetical protein
MPLGDCLIVGEAVAVRAVLVFFRIEGVGSELGAPLADALRRVLWRVCGNGQRVLCGGARRTTNPQNCVTSGAQMSGWGCERRTPRATVTRSTAILFGVSA